MSKVVNIDTRNKMKKVDVHCRQGLSEFFKISQLYGVLNEEYDIHVNGSIEMIGKAYENIKKVKIYANLCNKDGAILYVLHDWENYLVSEGLYHSFSLFCCAVDRFFDPSELEYVELYLSFNEKN